MRKLKKLICAIVTTTLLLGSNITIFAEDQFYIEGPQHNILTGYLGDNEVVNVLYNVWYIDGAFNSTDDTVKVVNLPPTIKKIYGYAFTRCPNLENVTLKNGLWLIENSFSDCPKLKYIKIPSSVEKLTRFSFFDCKNLEKVEFETGSKLEEISFSCFELCPKLRYLEIPSSVTFIWDEDFSNRNPSFKAMYGSINDYSYQWYQSLENPSFRFIDVSQYQKSDVNTDGTIDLSDANLELKAALGIVVLDDPVLDLADYDGNGSIELSDANGILKKALGIV